MTFSAVYYPVVLLAHKLTQTTHKPIFFLPERTYAANGQWREKGAEERIRTGWLHLATCSFALYGLSKSQQYDSAIIDLCHLTERAEQFKQKLPWHKCIPAQSHSLLTSP